MARIPLHGIFEKFLGTSDLQPGDEEAFKRKIQELREELQRIREAEKKEDDHG